jgi:hypothetical protein
MLTVLARLAARLFGTGFLGRVMDTVDRHVAADTDRERIKADLIAEHLRTRSDWMRAGGFWLMLIFAVPLALWWAAVILYSILWCQGCAWPQPWTIAALPSPLDQWAGVIVVSIFGVIGLDRFRR